MFKLQSYGWGHVFAFEIMPTVTRPEPSLPKGTPPWLDLRRPAGSECDSGLTGVAYGCCCFFVKQYGWMISLVTSYIWAENIEMIWIPWIMQVCAVLEFQTNTCQICVIYIGKYSVDIYIYVYIYICIYICIYIYIYMYIYIHINKLQKLNIYIYICMCVFLAHCCLQDLTAVEYFCGLSRWWNPSVLDSMGKLINRFWVIRFMHLIAFHLLTLALLQLKLCLCMTFATSYVLIRL